MRRRSDHSRSSSVRFITRAMPTTVWPATAMMPRLTASRGWRTLHHVRALENGPCNHQNTRALWRRRSPAATPRQRRSLGAAIGDHHPDRHMPERGQTEPRRERLSARRRARATSPRERERPIANTWARSKTPETALPATVAGARRFHRRTQSPMVVSPARRAEPRRPPMQTVRESISSCVAEHRGPRIEALEHSRGSSSGSRTRSSTRLALLSRPRPRRPTTAGRAWDRDSCCISRPDTGSGSGSAAVVR